jgi:hypothetical protein
MEDVYVTPGINLVALPIMGVSQQYLWHWLVSITVYRMRLRKGEGVQPLEWSRPMRSEGNKAGSIWPKVINQSEAYP